MSWAEIVSVVASGIAAIFSGIAFKGRK